VPKSSQSEAQHLLAGNVRRLREDLKWTQERAAEASGMAVRHFQKIEAGEVNVTIATLARVAKGFRVPVKAPSKKRGDEPKLFIRCSAQGYSSGIPSG
jgi:transcriptional regulator with XRE-family HTH domain